LGRGGLAGLFELGDSLGSFLDRQVQRRQQAHAVVPAAGDQQLLVAGQDHELAIVRDQFHPD
jgi:hypothetical protein